MEYFLLYSKIITFVWRLTGLPEQPGQKDFLLQIYNDDERHPCKYSPANTPLQIDPCKNTLANTSMQIRPCMCFLYPAKGNAVSSKRLKRQEQNQINLFPVFGTDQGDCLLILSQPQMRLPYLQFPSNNFLSGWIYHFPAENVLSSSNIFVSLRKVAAIN